MAPKAAIVKIVQNKRSFSTIKSIGRAIEWHPRQSTGEKPRILSCRVEQQWESNKGVGYRWEQRDNDWGI